MINYNHEHRARGGNNGFIGDGQFRHNYEIATRAEQRKDYGQAAHYYQEALDAASSEKHRTLAHNRKDTCEHLLRQTNKAKEQTAQKNVSKDPVIAELRALMSAPAN